MRHAAVLLVVVCLTGCGRATPEQVADGPLPDFSGWPTATDRPVGVSTTVWLYCRGPTPEEQRKIDAERERRGPHFRPSIVVRTNPEAFEAFRTHQPLPVGAVVVKEKHLDPDAKDAPLEYAAMIKREAGYDLENGDWEYLYVVPGPERQVSRGRLESCVKCHATARHSDYLYRSYLPHTP